MEMLKEINKRIQKLEREKNQKIQRRNQLDKELSLINIHLRELNTQKIQLEKIHSNIEGVFNKMDGVNKNEKV